MLCECNVDADNVMKNPKNKRFTKKKKFIITNLKCFTNMLAIVELSITNKK